MLESGFHGRERSAELYRTIHCLLGRFFDSPIQPANVLSGDGCRFLGDGRNPVRGGQQIRRRRFGLWRVSNDLEHSINGAINTALNPAAGGNVNRRASHISTKCFAIGARVGRQV